MEGPRGKGEGYGHRKRPSAKLYAYGGKNNRGMEEKDDARKGHEKKGFKTILFSPSAVYGGVSEKKGTVRGGNQ